MKADEDGVTKLKLVNYNDWNLPFAANVTLSDPMDDTIISSTNYLMMPCPQAFFSVLFVGSSVYEPADPITLNYTWYGENGYTIQGEWKELTISLSL